MEALPEYFGDEHTYLKDLRTIHQDIIVALDLFKGQRLSR